MRYACLLYFDPTVVFNGSPEGEAVLRDTGPFDAALESSGHKVAGHALQLPQSAITLKVRNGTVSTTDGPFMEAKEALGGLVVIEARDLNEAVRIGATIPYARIGSVEIRPLVDYSQPRPKL